MHALSAVRSLADGVKGPVMSPGDPGYEEELSPFNLSARHTPELVVAALDAQDVAAAVRWAAEHALTAAIAELAPYTTGRTFVNLHGRPSSADDRARPWAAETHARLRRVKQAYDPSDVFRFAHPLTPGCS